LTLSSPIILTAKTVLMCSISGLGRVRIRSFLTTGQSPTPASYYTARATATLYTIAKTFVNGFNTTGLGSICQFSYV
jgi:hypothetical protein